MEKKIPTINNAEFAESQFNKCKINAVNNISITALAKWKQNFMVSKKIDMRKADEANC
jgi:hypothetical protein